MVTGPFLTSGPHPYTQWTMVHLEMTMVVLVAI